MTKFLAIDQGTTSTKAIVFDESLSSLKRYSEKIDTMFPKSGWVEQKPQNILQTVKSAINKTISDDVVGLGITNQRETVVIWDRASGNPIYNAIVWQDRRTASRCKELRNLGYEQIVKDKTGLLLDPYFSATKIEWILDNVSNARSDALNGNLAFGTIESFLLWHLSEGKVHATDATNASRTMLYNIFENRWDFDLLELFNIPESILPDVTDNCANFGVSNLFANTLPIRSMIGDQQAAAVGLGCIEAGMMKATFGTGCFALLNIGEDQKKSESNLISTVAYQIEGQVRYALEGSIFNVGTILDWLHKNMNMFHDFDELNKVFEQSKTSNGVIFIPAFTGLGAPYWNSECRGAIFGLERNSSKSDIITAAGESISFQARDLVEAMCSDYSGNNLEILKVDGGVSQNNWLMQNVSDQIGIEVERAQNIEASAMGVAFLTGLSLGYFSNLNDIGKISKLNTNFNPSKNRVLFEKKYSNWKNTIKKLLD